MKTIALTKGAAALVDDDMAEVTNAPAGFEVDHINGNRLDNRRENLRVCTRLQNAWNRHAVWGASKYKGVAGHQSESTWRATIRVGGRQVLLGLFDDEDTAAHAYDFAAKKHFGEFAKLNFAIAPDAAPVPRDRKRAGAHRTAALRVFLDPAEADAITAAASSAGLTEAKWARLTLLSAIAGGMNLKPPTGDPIADDLAMTVATQETIHG